MTADDFTPLIGPVAIHFWGEPNKTLSKATELRWGNQGARLARLDKGTWVDNESGNKGGVLDLVKSETGIASNREAAEWLRENGFQLADDRPAAKSNGARPPRQRGGTRRDGSWYPVDDDFEPVAFYDYTDEQGITLFQVVRFEAPPDRKTFRQRHPNKRALRGWEWNLKGVRIVPYRLPELRTAIEHGETIFIPEGEKDVDNLIEQGLAATCNPMGAGKWPAEFAKYLEGAKRVILLPDNDDAGRAHVNAIGATLKPVVGECLVMDLPGLEEKEDVTDWYRGGGSTDDLFELVKEIARPWTAQVPRSEFGALRWEDLDRPGEELQAIIDGWYTVGDLSVTAGPSKSGKSFLLIHAGMIVALHATDHKDLVPDFFGLKVLTTGLVVYFAGEGSRGVKNRLRAFRREFKVPANAHVPFVLLTKKLDLLRPGVGDKQSDTDKLIAECKAWQSYYDLPLVMVVIDTLATASAGADENSAKDMTTVFSNCAKVRDETGAHVGLVHHMNASGGKVRGHGSIYANADQVVLVTKDEATNIRTALLDKQKDSPDGEVLHFELKSIELGTNPKTGKPITNCVVLDVGEKDKSKIEKRKGEFVPSDGERVYLKALFEALKRYGVRATAEMEDVPSTVEFVVPIEYVRDLFDRKYFTDEKDEKKRDQVLRAARSRAAKTLIKYNVIGATRAHVWHSGRPIRGFKNTQEPELDLPKAAASNLSDDDVAAFLGEGKSK